MFEGFCSVSHARLRQSLKANPGICLWDVCKCVCSSVPTCGCIVSLCVFLCANVFLFHVSVACGCRRETYGVHFLYFLGLQAECTSLLLSLHFVLFPWWPMEGRSCVPLSMYLTESRYSIHHWITHRWIFFFCKEIPLWPKSIQRHHEGGWRLFLDHPVLIN